MGKRARSKNGLGLKFAKGISHGLAAITLGAAALAVRCAGPVRESIRTIRNRQSTIGSSASLRPYRLGDFIGYEAVRRNLEIFITAALTRNELLDHVLLVGPSGCGKTTLSRIIATELDTRVLATSGPAITKANDLIDVLEKARKSRGIIFIDEIHRIRRGLQELLYEPMEEARCTVIGATTRAGLLTTPLRDRFGIVIQLGHYGETELEAIVEGAARRLGIVITPKAAREIARRARGTPRVAVRILRRAFDLATVEGKLVDQEAVHQSFEALEIDPAGLNHLDQKYLRVIAETYAGGPAGLDALAASLSESPDTIEGVVEPYLLERDFLRRTARGRVLGVAGLRHLGMSAPCRASTPSTADFNDC